MKKFRDFSIKNKERTIIISVSGVILILGLGISIVLNVFAMRKSMEENISLIARGTGTNCAGAVVFGDYEGAQTQLIKLKDNPNVLNAIIIDSTKNIFAEYYQNDSIIDIPTVKDGKNIFFSDDYLHVFEVISYMESPNFTIYLRASTEDLDRKIYFTIFITLIGLILLFLSTFFLANYAQKFISEPIVKLAKIIDIISINPNTPVDISTNSKDEIGELYLGFNNMMQQIKHRQNENDNARAELKESEAWFKSITSRANDAIIVIDEFLRITFWNTAAEKIFGYKSNEAKGKNLHHLIIHKNHRQRLLDTIATIKDDSSSVGKALEMQATKSDGKNIVIEISVSSILRLNKWNTVSIIRDITERKEAEEKLKEAKEKAEAADKMKTAFLTNMSHEIRTPMNAIIGFSNIIADPAITVDERKEYVTYIKNSSNSLLLLINDLIDVSKIESKQLRIKKTRVSLKNIIIRLFEMFADDVDKRSDNKIEFIYTIPITDENSEIEVFTDGDRIEQVLGHLIRNAIKFTDKGFIEFGYMIIDDTLQFYVKDTGIGISENKQTVIFDRFSKIEDDNTRLYRGSGLGLAISKSIVQLMGGDIWVESTLGRGSIFNFTVPYEKFVPYEQSIYMPKKPATIDWSKKNILVAEDEEANYKYLEVVLSKTGATLFWAKDGKEAVAIYRENNVDMVLMDIKMPQMDGYEAAYVISTIDKGKKIPIIAQTAFTSPEGHEEFAEKYFDDYISKPIRQEFLLSTMSKYM